MNYNIQAENQAEQKPMNVINVFALQKNLYTFMHTVGQEYAVVNTKTKKIVFAFKVIPSPEQVEFKIEKQSVVCKI